MEGTHDALMVSGPSQSCQLILLWESSSIDSLLIIIIITIVRSYITSAYYLLPYSLIVAYLLAYPLPLPILITAAATASTGTPTDTTPEAALTNDFFLKQAKAQTCSSKM